jgi:hypothetical protein
VQRESCQPFAITGFPPVIHKRERPLRTVIYRQLSGEKNSKRGEINRQRSYTLPLGRHCLSARAERKTVKTKKIAWEVLLFAKPFRNFVPECESRDPGLNGFCISDAVVCQKMQANQNNQSVVIDFDFYTRRFGDVQGGILRVNKAIDWNSPQFHRQE